MPRLDKADTSDALLKLLLIADSKAGKTPWAAVAAANYNVLYLDGDVGIQSLNKMDESFKKNLYYMPCGDGFDDNGTYEPRMIQFLVSFMTEGKFTWNDSQGQMFSRKTYKQLTEEADGVLRVKGGDDVWEVRPARMDHRDVVIIDSWTALVQSVMQWKADDLKVDLGDVEKIQREIYSGVGNKLTQILTMIRSWPCHVIVIAHPAEYVKTQKPIGKNVAKETDLKIEWTKMVPKSSSNPHALTMAKYFSDVGWLDVRGNGDTQLDFRQSNDRVIGGHLASATDARATTVADVIRAIGGYVPNAAELNPNHWLTIHESGSYEPAGKRPGLVLGAPKAADVVPTHTDGSPAPGPVVTQVAGGLAAMLAKSKGVAATGFTK
jgi:hypothetical protein